VIATFSTTNFLQEMETFRSEDATHQDTVGGRPPIELSADYDVVCAAPDDVASTLSSGTSCSRM
jgi:hypothetical protein